MPEVDESRLFRAIVLVLLLLLSSKVMANEQYSKSILFDIPRQRADLSLIQFAEQANLTLIVPFDQVQKEILNRLVGQYSIEEGINILLLGTRLDGTMDDDGQLSIVINQYSRRGKKEMIIAKNTNRSFFAGLTALISTIVSAPITAAQENDGDFGTRRIEEVVVTATKRAQSVQDVPISISVITGAVINERSIGNLEELSAYEPNLRIVDTSITTNIYMRGIGSGQDRGFEQAVGMFIDGIYMGRSKQYRGPFLDIERVEILRGPQPILFGKNTSAGAIKIETAKTQPGEAFSADLAVEYEAEYDGKMVTTVLSGSPSDTLGLRLAFSYEDSDGYANNTFRNIDEPAIEQYIARISGVWEPNDNLTFTGKFEHSDFSFDGALGEASPIGALSSGNFVGDLAGQLLLFGPTGAFALDPALEGDINFNRSSDNVLGKQGSDQKVNNLAITAETEFAEHTITAVIGYSEYEYTLGNDIDYLPVPLTQGALDENFDQTSVEIRVASPVGGVIDYLGGFYWQNNDIFIESQNTANFEFLGPIIPIPGGPFAISALNQGVDYQLDTETLSVFGEFTWNISDEVRITLGGRYSHESKDVSREGFCERLDGGAFDPANISDILAQGSGLCPTLITFAKDRSENHFMPSIQGQWDFTPDVMVYGKWNKSYKSGGINAAALATLVDIEYDEEKATGFEIGLKASLADGSAEINLALFNTEFEDLQVTTLTGGGQAVLSNAGKSITRGVELDGQWALTENLRVGGSLAYLDSEYDDYKDGPCNAVLVSIAAGAPCVQDLTGKTTSYAPDWSSHLFLNYTYPVNNQIEFHFGTDITYSDNYFYDSDLDPNTHQSSYWKFDARIGFAAADGSWDVSFLGKNLSNEKVAVWGTDIPLILGSYVAFTEPPRTLTVQARYHFGGL